MYRVEWSLGTEAGKVAGSSWNVLNRHLLVNRHTFHNSLERLVVDETTSKGQTPESQYDTLG